MKDIKIGDPVRFGRNTGEYRGQFDKLKCNMEPSLNIRSFRIGNLVYNPHLERIGYIAEITRADMTLFHGEMLIKEAGFYHEILDKVVL